MNPSQRKLNPLPDHISAARLSDLKRRVKTSTTKIMAEAITTTFTKDQPIREATSKCAIMETLKKALSAMGQGAHTGNPYLCCRKLIKVKVGKPLPDVQSIHTDQGHKCGKL